MSIIVEVLYEFLPFKRRQEREQFDRLVKSIPIWEKHDPDYLHKEVLPGYKLLLQESLAGSKWDVFRFREVERNAQELEIPRIMAATFMRGNLIETDADGKKVIKPPKTYYLRNTLLILLAIIMITLVGCLVIRTFKIDALFQTESTLLIAQTVFALFIVAADYFCLYLHYLYTMRMQNLTKVYKEYLSLKGI